jgi:uncharacterized protein (DUF58 family)
MVAVFFAPGEPALEARRSLSTDRITEGMAVTVSIQVENRSARIEEIHFSESSIFDTKSLDGDISKVALLNPGELLQYEYSLQGWRGSYGMDGLHARIIDPFGLFEIREHLPARGNILIYPKTTQLKAFPIRPPQTKGFSGPITSRKSGTGMDFFGVRQYQLGDSLRRINWKTSARHSVDLFTNEYEQERIADVCLILDGRPHGDISFQGRRLFEHAIHATASLADMFLNEGHCLSMLVYSAGISQVFPGYGKTQFERVMKTLARADTGTNYALEQLRSFPARLLPARGQLVFISPLAIDDLEPLKRFRAFGYAVLVISPDPLAFEHQNQSNATLPGYQLARRFARTERDLLLNGLHQAGIQVVNWQVDQPLSDVIDNARIQNTLHQRTAKVLL